MTNYKFYIINTVDRPDEEHVVQLVGEHKYEYLSTRLRSYGTLIGTRKDTTPIEDFGFKVTVKHDRATFSRIYESKATYLDDTPRQWQGSDEFVLSVKPVEA